MTLPSVARKPLSWSLARALAPGLALAVACAGCQWSAPKAPAGSAGIADSAASAASAVTGRASGAGPR